MGARGVEDLRECLPRNQQSRSQLTLQLWSLHGSGLGPLRICCSCWLGTFERPMTVGLGMSLTLLLALGPVFHLPSYLAQPLCEGLCLVLLYLAVLYLADVTGMYSIREE